MKFKWSKWNRIEHEKEMIILHSNIRFQIIGCLEAEILTSKLRYEREKFHEEFKKNIRR